ncbi:MAG: hypothetical protein H0Z24_03375 [Thermosipho sp. (in: Bacteria)]|nr:hypothetical protein [Thermosipho sp. (in: thermotogales)]
MKVKFFTVLILLTFAVYLAGGLVFIDDAYANTDPTDLSKRLEEIKQAENDPNTKDVIDPNAKKRINKLSSEVISLVGTIVMTIVVISGLWTAVKFATAGDNSQKKTVLKAALIMHILGILFLANYFDFINFSFKSLSGLFSGGN